MRVLLTGAGGQLGQTLQANLPEAIERSAMTRADLDITDAHAVDACVDRLQPDWIVNAAAYTSVDQAESEPDRAWAINRQGVAHLATAAHRHGARLLQVSTDFVFDGSQRRPYQPDDAPNPLNVYGQSKLAGEQAARECTDGDAVILRTAWVYSATGRNFLTTMVRLMREREQLKIVDDQTGTPTATTDLAQAMLAMMTADASGGIHHYTNAGEATWYDFAREIRQRLTQTNPDWKLAQLAPTNTAGFPTPARRPAYSVLGCDTVEALTGRRRHWRDALVEEVNALNCAHEP